MALYGPNISGGIPNTSATYNPGWWFPGVTLDLDFVNGRYYQAGLQVALTDAIAVTRASIGTADDLQGKITTFPAGGARITNKGLLLEETRTNVCLWSRDLSQAGSWTPTNATPLLDQVGIDGVANSASSLLATAGNGQILQAITLASSARWQTAYVKRLVGSGVVNMTMDGGSTWTAISVTDTQNWTRVAIPTQTLADPGPGFQIVTSGDKIAVDMVQNENNGIFATSPIPVTTVAIARAVDTIMINGFASWYSQTTGTFYCDLVLNFTNSSVNKAYFSVSDGTTGDEMMVLLGSAATWTWNIRDGASAQAGVVGGTQTANIANRLAETYASNDAVQVINGVLAGTPDVSLTLPTPDRGRLGARGDGISPGSGVIRRFAYWPSRLPNAQMIQLTA